MDSEYIALGLVEKNFYDKTNVFMMSDNLLCTPHLKPEEKTARRMSLLQEHANGISAEGEAPMKHAPVYPRFLPPELEPLSWIAGWSWNNLYMQRRVLTVNY